VSVVPYLHYLDCVILAMNEPDYMEEHAGIMLINEVKHDQFVLE
jgi:hypothetical protein